MTTELIIGKKYKLKKFDEKFVDEYPCVDPDMIQYFERTVTIKNRHSEYDWFQIKEDDGWWYSPNWFENLEFKLPEELFKM